MDRRSLLKSAAAAAALAPAAAWISPAPALAPLRRPRPGSPDWPTDDAWARLNMEVGNRLIRVVSPLEQCAGRRQSCDALFGQIGNPYFIRDHPALTQSLGWAGAWTSRASAYAVAAENAADVSAALRFAARHRLRLPSKAPATAITARRTSPDSLLIWTRKLTGIRLHDDFTPAVALARKDRPLALAPAASGRKPIRR